MSALLDANVLIALTVAEHVHHDAAEEWLEGWDQPVATCPITQGALVWHLLRAGATASEATAVVTGLDDRPGHELWPDDLGYDRVDLRGVVGHRQVTDAYLAALARARSAGRLVTFDTGLAALHADVAVLLDGAAG